ncbi:MAG: heme lyase CcmF/NrfE family subunit [Deltaproteobacteria bacterium]|nr:heme lyase CcmF/NrfE family subunit [Deltaproteobacteria bacterium]
MSDLGYYASLLALLAAGAAAVAGAIGGVTRSEEWATVARRGIYGLFALTSVALACLFYAFATFDFQLEYVSQNAARTMPTHYRLAAVWGAQAGSLLLWTWMTAAYAAIAITVQRRERALIPWVCLVLGLNAAFFLVLLNFVSNPFEKLPATHVMSDGNGMNPLLQHPVMMIHPLVLYLGMTGFSVPFAFALAALASGQLGTTWMRVTRRWTLWAWCFLSIGILLGGRWAYEVLGWGGYWAWDPVENASFMPWLAGTAYLHSVMVQEKRDMLKIWNFVLIGLTYGLCLFGTMITRAGLVRSVHAFAQTEIFGVLFAWYVGAVLLAFVVAVLWRVPQLRSPNRLESVVSREASFVINNWLFMAILAVVFFGTLYPKFSTLIQGKEVLFGPQWFDLWLAPIGIGLLFLTGVGPLLAWRRATPANLRRQLIFPAACGALTFAALLALLGTDEWLAALTWGIAALVTGTICEEFWRATKAKMRGGDSAPSALAKLFRMNQQRYGGYVVHLGVVFFFIGFTGQALDTERLENLAPGGTLEVRDYKLKYLTAEPILGEHHGGAEARLALYKNDEPLATLTPEKRMYWLEQQPNSIPAVYSTFAEDFYVILTAIEPNGSATLKVFVNPLVSWIWLGGLTFVIGTVLVMWPHPRRAAAA